MDKTEIYILSGFLGSGKTTLLKKLLEDERNSNRKVAVMMNELGKVSIDSNEVDEDIPMKELLDGCICCTIQDKLEAQLQELLYTNKPDVIYIETTGAAHPVETLDAVLSPLFAPKLLVKGIISVVDGKRWLARRSYSPQVQQLLIEQVRHADLILLNKADQLSESEKATLTTEIQGLNNKALSILTSFSKVGMKQVRSLTINKKEETKTSHVEMDLNLSTYVYTFTKPIKQERFESFLMSLPDTLYRIKGYVRFTHSPLPYLFQFSYGMPIYLKEEMSMPLNLVFIGEGINWKPIEEQLYQLEKEE